MTPTRRKDTALIVLFVLVAIAAAAIITAHGISSGPVDVAVGL